MHAIVDSCSKIRARQEAVCELTQTEKPSLFLLKSTLHKLPDLEQKLCSTYHKKVRVASAHSRDFLSADTLLLLQCSPAEFYNLVRILNRISQQLDSFSEMALSDVKSELLLMIIGEVCLWLQTDEIL